MLYLYSLKGCLFYAQRLSLEQILIECLPVMYVEVPMYPAEPFVPWNLFETFLRNFTCMEQKKNQKSNSYIFPMHNTKFTNLRRELNIDHQNSDFMEIFMFKKAKLVSFLYLYVLYRTCSIRLLYGRHRKSAPVYSVLQPQKQIPCAKKISLPVII